MSENSSNNSRRGSDQQLQALDSLGIVVGEIAHDFNNILSLIFGYVEMALSEIPEGQRARSDLEHVLAAGDRAKELVAHILTFSNRTKLKHSEISIEKPIIDAIAFIEHRLPNKIELVSSIETNPNLFVHSSEAEIYQIINNLCTNSIQAMPDSGGVVEVSLKYIDKNSDFVRLHPELTADNYAKITVKDTGCGMGIETLEKMYTPFFTTARKGGDPENRAGLGLTTVYNIVLSHEGSIYYDSVINEGTTFEICIPLINNEVSGVSEKAPESASSQSTRNILFIDDDPSIIEMARKILEKNNFSVTSFVDGNEALAYFQQQPHMFDLVISDLAMPIISGTELASKLSTINPNIPIILTTGFSEKITAATCKQWGISKVINKPFSIQDLLSTIEELTS